MCVNPNYYNIVEQQYKINKRTNKRIKNDVVAIIITRNKYQKSNSKSQNGKMFIKEHYNSRFRVKQGLYETKSCFTTSLTTNGRYRTDINQVVCTHQYGSDEQSISQSRN